MSKPEPAIYKVIFLNQGQVFEMYAKQIYQSDLWGFLEIEEFVFGERSQLVVDPSEEKLKSQFEGVIRSFVPMRSCAHRRGGTPGHGEDQRSQGRRQRDAVPHADAGKVTTQGSGENGVRPSAFCSSSRYLRKIWPSTWVACSSSSRGICSVTSSAMSSASSAPLTAAIFSRM